MSALIYLAQRNVVNYIKDIFRKKSTIAIAIALAAFAWLMVFSSSQVEQPEAIQNLDVFGAFLIGIYFLIFVMSVSQGMKKGTALFSMADVNLLFTSPVDPRKTLLYGVLKQTSILIFASVFLLAQSSNLRMNFGVGGEALGGLIIGYVLLGVCSTLFSVNIYALCATHPHWRKRVEMIIRIAVAALVLGIVGFIVNGYDIVNALRGFLGSDYWNYVPIIGWARAITIYASTGDWLIVGVYVIVFLLGCGACTLWLAKSDADFFEDVLTAAENAQAVKESAAKGKFMEASGEVSKRAKRELPELKGKGASVFFHKIMRENSRGGFWLFTLTTLAPIGAVLFGMILGGAIGEIDGSIIWGVLVFAAYLLIFLSLRSDVNKELTQHYLYTAPASSFKKLVAISAPQLINYLADSAVFFAMALFVLKTDLLVTLMASIAYFTIGIVFTSGQILVEKLLRNMKLKFLIMILYFLILMLLVVPGITVGIILETMGMTVLGYAAACAWNVFVSALVVLFCRNLLETTG